MLWSAIGPAAALVAVTLVAFLGGLELTGGRLVYPLDDPYIHMSIARNLALHGSWGVNPGRFEPASSSPLWTLLLAAIDRLVGVHDVTPLAMNLLLAMAVVLVLDRWLNSFIAPAPVRGAVVLAIALAIPLPAVIASGMEAPLHVLLTLLLTGSVLLQGPGSPARPWRIAALATLCVLTRFESLFLAGPLALAAWVGGRRRVAVAVVGGSLAALGGYLAFSLPQGGLWLPNSVLAKAPLAEFKGFEGVRNALVRIPYQLFVRRFSHMTALLIAAGWLLLPRAPGAGHRPRAARALLAVFGSTAILHIEFAALGWFYRYEAYLVALGLASVAGALAAGTTVLPGRLAARPAPAAVRAIALLAILVLATPIATRALRSAREIAPAMGNIYEQQFQMARLVAGYFPGRGVALNDLGAIGYYGNARVLDLMGLADGDIARARIAGRFGSDAIARACAARGVEVALVYRSWFEGASAIPRDWIPLADWTVPEGVTVGDTTVTIFATRAESAPRVRAALDAFDRELPPRVRVTRWD